MTHFFFNLILIIIIIIKVNIYIKMFNYAPALSLSQPGERDLIDSIVASIIDKNGKEVNKK